MANFNKIILAGNVTKDIELSYIANTQTAVAIFGVATNRNWTGKDGQKKTEVCFFEVNAFAKTAETIKRYVTKGDPILIEGRMKYESWAAQDGSKRSKLKVIVETFQFLNTGSGQAAGGSDQSYQRQAGEENQAQVGTPNPDYNPDYVPEDDSIPF